MSAEDLGFLCGWGGAGLPLLAWEDLGFTGTVQCTDACIVDHVEYWVELHTEHIWINGVRRSRGLPPISEEEMHLLHTHVCARRWARRTPSLCQGSVCK